MLRARRPLEWSSVPDMYPSRVTFGIPHSPKRFRQISYITNSDDHRDLPVAHINAFASPWRFSGRYGAVKPHRQTSNHASCPILSRRATFGPKDAISLYLLSLLFFLVIFDAIFGNSRGRVAQCHFSISVSLSKDCQGRLVLVYLALLLVIHGFRLLDAQVSRLPRM